MPELPEVETVRRGLEPVLVDARIEGVEVQRAGLRFAFPAQFAERVRGQTVLALGRRAKYLIAQLSSGEALILHLGMTGRFTVLESDPTGSPISSSPGSFYYTTPPEQAHDHVIFHLSNSKIVVYNDARRFGFMTLLPGSTLQDHPPFDTLGLEPLEGELTGETLQKIMASRKTSLKAALLDQRLIAGLGNIYVCEALHQARLAPERAAGSLNTLEAVRLAEAIGTVLQAAIRAGGSTLRDYAGADGKPGMFQQTFKVYDRANKPCSTPKCKGIISRTVQNGRSTFACALCQR